MELDQDNESIPSPLPPNDEGDSSKKKAKPPRVPKTRSEIWKHFEKLPKPENEDETPKCRCNYCGAELSCHPTKHGTNHLWNHFKQAWEKNRSKNEDKKQKILSFGGDNKSLLAVAFNKEACRAALCKYLVVDELPYRHVEGEGFKEFVRTLQPRFEIPSRMTVSRDVLKAFEEEKKKLKDILKDQRISMTTDTWTSIQNINYMVITAHWIDSEFNYQKRIINFCQVVDHRGETIGKEIQCCLQKWGITKLFTITVDNASSNDVAIRYLKHIFSETENGLILDGKFLHMRCCAHITNLIVGEGLKERHESIAAIRNAVRYVRSSPARLKTFKEFVAKVNISARGLLTLDVPTRWNSTFLMLTCAVRFQQVFQFMLDDDFNYIKYFDELDKDGNRKVGPPRKEDWENALVFIEFLERFYQVTLRFSGSTYVTANKYFVEISDMQQELYMMASDEIGDPLLQEMAKGMVDKYDKYWGNVDKCNEALFIALVLDPRYKLKYLKHSFGTFHDAETTIELVSKIEHTLRELFDLYHGGVGSSTILEEQSLALPVTQTTPQHHDQSTESSSLMSSLGLLSRKRRYVATLHRDFCNQSKEVDGGNTRNEVDQYFIDPVEPMVQGDRFDILKWWFVNSSKYPILSSIARDILAIPVTTVASESAFSMGGRILDPFRSSLSPTTVEALICLKNWWSKSHQPIIVKEFYDETDEAELQPEDIFENGTLFITLFA